MIESFSTSWEKFLKNEFEKDYFKKLSEYIDIERKTQIVFPPLELTFAALNITSHEKVKVVILGQDPHHNNYRVSKWDIVKICIRFFGTSNHFKTTLFQIF